MTYKVVIFQAAFKELSKLKRLHKVAISEAIKEIQENPLSGKPLTRELQGKYSWRVGVYRIIYKVSKKDKIIYIDSAGHRSKIYNQ